MGDINRLKLVLIKRTSKWLAEQLGVNLQLFQSGVLIHLNHLELK